MVRTDRSVFFQEHHKYLLTVLKPLLCKVLRSLNKLPEPTKENTRHCINNNNEIALLIDLYHDFFSLENNPGREKELRGMWKLVIIIAADLYYWERGQWILRRILQFVIQGRWHFGPPPRRPWWGEGEVCYNCGQDKGSQRVFANCPVDMHA